jgi:hypothetical protein
MPSNVTSSTTSLHSRSPSPGDRCSQQPYWKHQKFWLGILAGQVLAATLTGTNIFTKLLANEEVFVPTTQSLLNYLLLAVVYTTYACVKDVTGFYNTIKNNLCCCKSFGSDVCPAHQTLTIFWGSVDLGLGRYRSKLLCGQSIRIYFISQCCHLVSIYHTRCGTLELHVPKGALPESPLHCDWCVYGRTGLFNLQ